MPIRKGINEINDIIITIRNENVNLLKIFAQIIYTYNKYLILKTF